MGCRQYTSSSHATTLESNKSVTPYHRGFALYDGNQFVVAMYKVGAEEVRKRLQAKQEAFQLIKPYRSR
jgi:hypothetical protein